VRIRSTHCLVTTTENVREGRLAPARSQAPTPGPKAASSTLDRATIGPIARPPPTPDSPLTAGPRPRHSPHWR
jgi:hypothetical protein